MPQPNDLIVIGAGPGGYVAAIRAAQLGKSVVCIDKRGPLGGTCLNVGCIPSKALLDSSELFEITNHRLAKHGISVGKVALDVAAMMKRKDHVVKSLTDGIGFLRRKTKIATIHGTAKLLAPGKVEVTAADGTKSVLEAGAILLAAGSEVATLPSLPLDGKQIVSSTEALSFDAVPPKLIVVGGGYIGLELGSVWARLGSKVTVLEFLPRILPLTDTEIAGLVQKSLAKQGMEFHLSTKVTGAKIEGGKVTVQTEASSGNATFQADKVLVAVGRKPSIAGLGLDTLGVKTHEKTGKISVNDKFETSVKGIYAIGDLIDGPMLAHKASEEGIAFAESLAGNYAHVNHATIPSVIYIWPEVASVGQTEEQVKESGREYRVGKFPFSASGRAKCMDESEGLVKIIADAETDRVLGVHIFGPRASDLIAECVTIMEFKGSAEDIARIVHGHPTLSESVGEAARMAWLGKAIHV
ncbi:MAG: dihydrolipoyl dehydrogenase [Planctomycetes bacterium]|nr:dihydrolipoyl dehydrogenase [Planctomycetota bacterium]